MHRPTKSNKKRLAALVALTLLATSHAYAMPSGGEVKAGQASITKSGNVMNINQGSQKAVINWQDFGIKKAETVNFNQNRNMAVLNRVTGNNASGIYGKMNAGGTVFLVNPNGITFGKGAEINVGGLIASTILCLLMMPTFYLILSGDGKKKRRKRRSMLSMKQVRPSAGTQFQSQLIKSRLG